MVFELQVSAFESELKPDSRLSCVLDDEACRVDLVVLSVREACVT
jgi:hypothetical protein